MHDIRAIREDPAAFDAAMARRKVEPVADALVQIDSLRRRQVTDQQEFQSARNALAKDIAVGRRTGADTSKLEQQATDLKLLLETAEQHANSYASNMAEQLKGLPNLLDPSVPDGADATANRVLKQSPQPTASGREHDELGTALNQMDFTAAAKIAGARFTVLRGPLARMARALGQFMFDLHTTEHGYEEVAVPLLVNDATMYGTGQLPKFAEDLFRTTDGRWLIPTAEVPLTNLVAGDIIPAARLPIRMAALTECFRSEAGSAGRDTRGMLRQHQFQKVELVSITHPDDSDAEHERMTRCAETVLERLELPYRRVLLCAGDTGFSAAKTYDLEVWLPGQGAWREISSCSTMHAFQARRMNARCRTADGKIHPVHTLNGSGVAVGRALIAVMETYQQPDGAISVPTALQSYMAGITTIR